MEYIIPIFFICHCFFPEKNIYFHEYFLDLFCFSSLLFFYFFSHLLLIWHLKCIFHIFVIYLFDLKNLFHFSVVLFLKPIFVNLLTLLSKAHKGLVPPAGQSNYHSVSRDKG